MRTAIVTALADNPVGRLVEDLMLQGGVALDHLRWVEYDGIGRSVRNGLNFTERGFGVRGRGGLLRPRPHGGLAVAAGRDRLGADLWRRGRALVSHRRDLCGAFASTTPEVALEAMRAARDTAR